LTNKNLKGVGEIHRGKRFLTISAPSRQLSSFFF
jgi:hypothetical protein